MSDDDDLPLSPTAAPPPPSPELLARMSGLAPVRPRVPALSWLAVLAASAAFAALGLTVFRMRPDLGYLPRAWIVGVGLAWLAAAALPLWAVLVPPRGQVLPDSRRALIVGLAALALVLAVSFLATASAPGHSRVSGRFWAAGWHCAAITLAVFAGGFTIACLAMRRLFPIGAARAGLAGGAAAGALGGLLLHVICPYADAMHVGVAHAGTVVLCAAIGAAVAHRTFSR